MPRLLVYASALLLLACSSEGELPPPPPVERMFPDQQAVIAELVARVDADGDGALSPEEYTRYDNGRDAFIDVDRDGDQRLDPAEIGRALRHTDPGYYNNPTFNAASTSGGDEG